MTSISLTRALAVAAASTLLAATAFAQDVTGAGATFPAPLYAKWADAYNKATGQKINYQSVGSGAGMRQIRGKTVDFGASDVPLTDADLAKDGLIQFPTVIGGVVPVVNVRGIGPGQLKLSGQVLGDIYLGKVTKWNDPAITALNPGLPLPDTAIAPVRRADGSGTTFIFTNYLSKVNAEWKSKVGEAAAVNWPTGAGGKGNEGAAAFVQRLPNSIGYVEYSYARTNKMAHVQLRNLAGNFVNPDDSSFKAAAAEASRVTVRIRSAFTWVLARAGVSMSARIRYGMKPLPLPTKKASSRSFMPWPIPAEPTQRSGSALSRIAVTPSSSRV
jgi:phosphate transport system substrate-binding protein